MLRSANICSNDSCCSIQLSSRLFLKPTPGRMACRDAHQCHTHTHTHRTHQCCHLSLWASRDPSFPPALSPDPGPPSSPSVAACGSHTCSGLCIARRECPVSLCVYIHTSAPPCVAWIITPLLLDSLLSQHSSLGSGQTVKSSPGARSEGRSSLFGAGGAPRAQSSKFISPRPLS